MHMLLCAVLSVALALGSALPAHTVEVARSQSVFYTRNNGEGAFEPDLFALGEQDERTVAALLSDAAPLGGSVTLLKGTEFNSKIPDSASSIVFTDIAAPDGAIDLSAAQDGGVVGWLADGVFYVSTQREGVPTQANENSAKMFFYKTRLESLDLTMLRTDGVRNMFAMFAYLPSLTELDLSLFNTSGVTNMSSMFAGHSTYGDTALTELDLSSFDTSRVTDMSFMFNHCIELTSLDLSSFDTSSVKSMKGMFQQSSYGEKTSLTSLDVSTLDTSSVTDMGWMFYGLSKLTYIDVSGFDTSKVESMHHMFAHSHSLAGLDVSGWDVSSVKTLNAAFHSTAITEIDMRGFDTSRCESFAQMLEGCEKLTEIRGLECLDTSSARDFFEMFKECAKIESLDLSSFDTSSADDTWVDPYRGISEESMKDMFKGMTGLRRITLGERFSFDGSDKCSLSCTLPTNLFDGSYGRWYDVKTGLAYTPAKMPNNRAASYTLGPPVRTYTVVLDPNGAKLGYTESLLHETGSAYAAPDNGYINDGFVFVGWNTSPDGAGVTYMPGDEMKNLTSEESITLYAQWVSEDDFQPEQVQRVPVSAAIYTLLALGVYLAIAYLTVKIWRRINNR